MIHQKYLDQAHRIRKDFNSTNLKLVNLSRELGDIHRDMEKTVLDLEEINKNIKSYSDEKELVEEINKHLYTFELQAGKIQKKFDPLNDNLEKLKEEEKKLFVTLVNEYPHLKQEDIVEQVHKYLKDKEGIQSK